MNDHALAKAEDSAGDVRPASAPVPVATRGFATAREAIQATFALVRELVGLRVCLLARVDRGSSALTIVESLDEVDLGLAPGTVLRLVDTPCDEVVSSAKPLRVPDLAADALFRDRPIVRRLGLRPCIGVPLCRSDGSIWGTLVATDTVERETSDVQLHTLALYAKLLVLEFEREEQHDAIAARAQTLAEQLATIEALQEERLRACRLQAVLEATATVSHKINNPLTVLQIRLGRIQKRCPEDALEELDDVEAALEATEAIHRVAVQLRNVVEPVSTRYVPAGTAQMLDLTASTKTTPPGADRERKR